jgi:hypothetical protein
MLSTTFQFDNVFKEKSAMANYLSSISVAMNKVVKLLLQLVKVCGDAKASSSVAQGSAVKYKADFDEELLNKLKNGKLVELYQKLLSWEPYPELASYHISFLKNYLALLVHFQQHQTSQVSEKISKSLFNWICNQKMYLKWYKLGTSEEKKGKFHIDDRYVRYLRKLGVDVVLKLDTEADEE